VRGSRRSKARGCSRPIEAATSALHEVEDDLREASGEADRSVDRLADALALLAETLLERGAAPLGR
jgi:hypothetical protein